VIDLDLDADAVLFDLDGTLVDSSASVLRAWYRVAAALATPFAEFEPYVHGIPAPEVIALVAPDLAPADVRDMTE
jgi:mannitol-1-/sugar-/sorbitol-6-phosphatase